MGSLRSKTCWFNGITNGLLLRLFLVVAVFSFSRANESLIGHQVINLYPANPEQVELLQRVRRDASDRFDFWSAPDRPGKVFTIRAHKRDTNALINSCKRAGIPSRIVHENMHKLVKRHAIEIEGTRKPFLANQSYTEFDLGQYHTHAEMNNYLKSLNGAFEKQSNLTSLVKIGKSYEGNEMIAIKIAGRNRTSPDDKLPVFWIDAGIHAREWAAPAVALYTIHRLLTSTAPEDLRIRDNIDWYILPNANPDGYIYSMQHNENRYWRKTRSPQGCRRFRKSCDCDRFPRQCCFGVDPNRNWDHHWGELGASRNPCQETYRGKTAHSEPEVAAMAAFLQSIKDDMKAYISLHSYSDLWLVPYGFAKDAYPDDFDELITLARECVHAVNAVKGSNYTAEHSAGLYPASGASDDWVKGKLNIKWPYTIELPPHQNSPEANEDDGYGGFHLDADKIIPTGTEIFEGLRVVAERILLDDAEMKTSSSSSRKIAKIEKDWSNATP